ncbi:MAG: hypothetical protein RQM92_16265 [Candidatus Syntrophopropionicum ammoniitolerans]
MKGMTKKSAQAVYEFFRR